MTETNREKSDIASISTVSLNLTDVRITTEDCYESSSDEEEITDGDKTKSSIVPAHGDINIENSSDVIIGNVTQFHGPVTIYQNSVQTNIESDNKKAITNAENICANGAKLVATETFSGKPLSSLREVSFVQNKKIFLILLSISVLLICVSIIVTLSLYSSNQISPDEETETKAAATGKHQLISRSRWGGRPPLYVRPIHQPTKYVIISHTVSSFCETISACSLIVAQAQSQHVHQSNSPDVGYNFLIGGDENIYVGRGWDASNFHMENSIGISFIGNFIYDRLTPGMIEATMQLLQYGLDKNKLDKDYKIVAHNQTYNTLSPGTNVYKNIIFWPHYSSELLPVVP